VTHGLSVEQRTTGDGARGEGRSNEQSPHVLGSCLPFWGSAPEVTIGWDDLMIRLWMGDHSSRVTPYAGRRAVPFEGSLMTEPLKKGGSNCTEQPS
jgi:hypothetical protein